MGKLRTAISLAVVFTVAFAGTAVANHVYNDVPTSSVFHDEIAEIGETGCADGFPGGLFKPEDPVKRQQMARFISRCGGRAASGAGTEVSTHSMDIVEVASATVLARADGFVVVTASGSAYTSNEGQCPCAVNWWLVDDAIVTNSVVGTVPGDPTADGNAYAAMSATHVFTISAGEEITYTLRAVVMDDSVGMVSNSAELSAVYVPFAGAPPLG